MTHGVRSLVLLIALKFYATMLDGIVSPYYNLSFLLHVEIVLIHNLNPHTA